MIKKKPISECLYSLSLSKFRSSFKLKEKDIEYIDKVGIENIKIHAKDILNKRIKVKPINDGKQTPYKNHPVFISEHATATCCRGCINKWYNLPLDRELSDDEIDYLVEIIYAWILKEYDRYKIR